MRGQVIKTSVHKSDCSRCKGCGKVDICDRCGGEIHRYENGIPLCSYCISPKGIRKAMNLQR